MELYLFAKKNGNCQLFGADCAVLPQEIIDKQTELTTAGYELSDPAEYEAQVIQGATASSENSAIGAGEVESSDPLPSVETKT